MLARVRLAGPAAVLGLALAVVGCTTDPGTTSPTPDTSDTSDASASDAAPIASPTAAVTADPMPGFTFDRALEPADGSWAAPYGVDVASDGTIWVADTGNHRVVGLHPDGSETVLGMGEPGSGDGEFSTLGFGSLAVGPDDTLHVVDNGNHRVQSFAPDGAFLRSFGEQGDGPGQFTRAIGVAVDPDGNVHVTDDERPEVQVFDANGKFVRAHGGGGSGPGQFQHATGIDVDATGRAWVTDYEARRLQVFDADGAFVAELAAPGPAGTSEVLEGVEVTSDGAVLVTAYRDGQVLAVPLADGDPATLAGDAWPVVAGEPGLGEGQFTAPVDLAVTPDGDLVVTDQTLSTVQVFTPS